MPGSRRVPPQRARGGLFRGCSTPQLPSRGPSSSPLTPLRPAYAPQSAVEDPQCHDEGVFFVPFWATWSRPNSFIRSMAPGGGS